MEYSNMLACMMPEGDIKVNAEELKQYLLIKEGSLPPIDGFQNYFLMKYLELPSIRVEEHDAYELLQKAKELAKTPEERKSLDGFWQNYQEIRSRRMELVERLQQEQKKYTMEGRVFGEGAEPNPRQGMKQQTPDPAARRAAMHRGMAR
ncbi:MAG: hypothetical protein HFI34_12920 [Lachnospiraceae bacterium]|nr:hypothetical protein [Lachnospiraceae bacterium]